jgi:hypothetical protein
MPMPAGHEHGGESATVARDGSGTSWMPDLTPMFGFHLDASGWQVMLHGNLFAQFLYETGAEHHRGHQAGSINWGMLMADRAVGSGHLGLRGMVSLEPWTIRGCGYPNTVASGEICNGDTIHDRQHPHDLFMEVAATYDRPLTSSLRWQLYGGPAGEPAIGPPAFPHRLSSFANPIAPIAHHWLDSTHISFGVVTTGIYTQRWKIETSLFNGREPDPSRTDFDLGALDSIAVRQSFAPAPGISVQISAAHLEQAEAGIGSQPRTDVNRVTASAIFHRKAGPDRWWATTAAFGLNSHEAILPTGHVGQTTPAALLESSVIRGEVDAWFGRAELVDKPAHDLHADEFEGQAFLLTKFQGGYVRYLRPWHGLLPGVGGSVDATVLPTELAPRYDGRVAPGFGVFFTVRPRGH